MNDRDVLVTGLGILSPIGLNVPDFLTSLVQNRSGITQWHSPLLRAALPAGVILEDVASKFTKLELPYLDRCSQFAMLAANQAVHDAGIASFEEYGTRAGIFYGSVAGGAITEHETVRRFYVEQKEVSKPYAMMACMLNAPASLLSIKHQVLGPVMTHSSACTSSGAAIGDAMRGIQAGHLDIALAGGADAAFTPAFISGWVALRALATLDEVDNGASCKPFSAKRTGLVLSEGSVFLVLESRASAMRRGAAAYARLSGYGIASDGYHIGSPHNRGQVAALRSALTDACLDPSDIGYLNAHATATGGGDPIETTSINTVFDRVPVSSTKAIHGHLLGVASAIELAVAIAAVNRSFLPATAHLDSIDPACDLNHVVNTPVFDTPIAHAISLSAGFGGTNVALIASNDPTAARKDL